MEPSKSFILGGFKDYIWHHQIFSFRFEGIALYEGSDVKVFRCRYVNINIVFVNGDLLCQCSEYILPSSSSTMTVIVYIMSIFYVTNSRNVKNTSLVSKYSN